MHPVFVEAVKKNQIGVAPQERALPGRRDAARNHPAPRCGRRASAELANAPVVAGVALRRSLRARSRRPRWRSPRPNPRQPAAKSSGGSLFGSLFASKPAKPRPPSKSGSASIAWRAWSACAATTPDAKAKPPRRAEAEAGGQADQRRLAWRDPQPSRPRPQPIKTTEAQARGRSGRARSPRAQPPPRRPARDERRRAGGADRQLRQPLVGLPLNDHRDVANEIAGQFARRLIGFAQRAMRRHRV